MEIQHTVDKLGEKLKKARTEKTQGQKEKKRQQTKLL